MTAKEIAKIAANAIEDKKGIDTKIIEISKISVMADYFVISGGSNPNQVNALVENVEEELSKAGVHTKHIEGHGNSNWVLLDYGDVIIHIFNEDDRLFYDLEKIWSDGKDISIEEL